MRFKIGDKVKIKKEIDNNRPAGYSWIASMDQLKGTIQIITGIHSNHYKIRPETREYYFHETWVEPADIVFDSEGNVW